MKKYMVFMLIALLAIAVAACTQGPATQPDVVQPVIEDTFAQQEEKKAVTASDDDDNDEEDDEIDPLSVNLPISEEDAKALALLEVNGEVTDVELEDKKSTIVWEIEIQKDGKEYDVVLDAYSGKVLAVNSDDETEDENEVDYETYIVPSDFSSTVDNKYFKLTPGTMFVYEGKGDEGTFRVETIVTEETKVVQGVTTVVVWDREYLNGEVIEDTKDWYAQDKNGNVWYFGEESYEIVDGERVNDEGSWESGVDGAQAGIIMLANPKAGDEYYQEYYPGEAEDKGTVVSLNEGLQMDYGDFTDCVKIRDWTPLDPTSNEHKYFCSEVGFVAYEVDLEDGETMQLIDVTQGNSAFEEITAQRQEKSGDITEEEAIEIALAEVSGTVTDVEIEKKFGATCYVVEVRPTSGGEVDVIIEIATGEVLGVED